MTDENKKTTVRVFHFANFWCSVSKISFAETADKETTKAIVAALKKFSV